MLSYKIDQAKSMFFDRPVVHKAVDAGTRRNLSRFGAFTRTRDRSSQKRRKKVSDPGSPPSAHEGLVKDKTFFVYEPNERAVIIGPAKLNKPGLALEALEYGGESSVFRYVRGKKEERRVTIAARPHTTPAFQEELKRLPENWKDSVT